MGGEESATQKRKDEARSIKERAVEEKDDAIKSTVLSLVLTKTPINSCKQI